MQIYDKAITLKPDYAEAYINRSTALQDLRQPAAALQSCDKAIALKPDYAEAYNDRGIVLRELEQFDAAVVSYDKAISIKPDYAEAYLNRGTALQELMQLQQAQASFQKALELKPDFCSAKWLSACSTIPPLFLKQDNIEISRTAFAKALEDLNEWFVPSRMDNAHEAVGASQPFYLAYQEVDNKELLSRYGVICHRLMDHWQRINQFKPHLLSGTGRIRIGIVTDHIRNHSVWHAIVKGWISNLEPGKFELHILMIYLKELQS